MKLILLEDVYNQGVAGDVVDVAPGYARNYLIPRGLAVKATPGAMKQLENLRKQADVRRAELEKQVEKIAEQVEELTLYFPVKAGERGKLYGSVTNAEIAEQLNEELGIEFDPRRVGDRPLRELGTFQVPVRLETGVTANVKVVVHRDDVDPRVAEQVHAEAEAQGATVAEYEEQLAEGEFAEAAYEQGEELEEAAGAAAAEAPLDEGEFEAEAEEPVDEDEIEAEEA